MERAHSRAWVRRHLCLAYFGASRSLLGLFFCVSNIIFFIEVMYVFAPFECKKREARGRRHGPIWRCSPTFKIGAFVTNIHVKLTDADGMSWGECSTYDGETGGGIDHGHILLVRSMW